MTGNSAIEDGTSDLWMEVEVPVPWGKVTGKWWGPREKQPILALHGWQDNAGSFDRLCPLLPKNISIYCIDLPGHGKSSHYPTGIHYYVFWDGISLIRRLVRYFKWKNLIILGHSLGGALSFMYAASFPNEVSKFISIDIAGPTIRNHDNEALKLGTNIDKFLDYENLSADKLPIYEYDDMINIAYDAYKGSLCRKCTEILMIRGMSPAPKHLNKNGYHFARDPRLKVALLGMFSLDQVLAYAKKIKCKVLNIRAVPGMTFENSQVYQNIIEKMKENAEIVIFKQIPGSHHLHLTNPERISDVIKSFLEI